MKLSHPVVLPRHALATAAAVTLLGLAPLATHAATSSTIDPDGLQGIKLPDIDHAWARPGLTLGRYTKIRLEPVEVSFDKNWNPTRTGSSLHLRPRDREAIRDGMAQTVRDEFARALTAHDGYTLSDEDGADVLRLRVAIVDLYVTAPDTMEPGRMKVYTVSTGESTLKAELIDSVSGAVVARLVDTRESRSPSGRLELTDRIRNQVEAERVAEAWGRSLRKYLDAARRGAP